MVTHKYCLFCDTGGCLLSPDKFQEQRFQIGFFAETAKGVLTLFTIFVTLITASIFISKF